MIITINDECIAVDKISFSTSYVIFDGKMTLIDNLGNNELSEDIYDWVMNRKSESEIEQKSYTT